MQHLSCLDLLDFTAADAPAPAAATSKQDAAVARHSPFVVAPAATAYQQQQKLPDLKKLFLLSKREMENAFGNLFDL